MNFTSKHHGPLSARAVKEYRHLGTWNESRSRRMFTIAARASEAKSSMKPIFRRALGNKRLRIETRMMLTQSLVLSRSTYNSHIWSELRI